MSLLPSTTFASANTPYFSIVPAGVPGLSGVLPPPTYSVNDGAVITYTIAEVIIADSTQTFPHQADQPIKVTLAFSITPTRAPTAGDMLIVELSPIPYEPNPFRGSVYTFTFPLSALTAGQTTKMTAVFEDNIPVTLYANFSYIQQAGGSWNYPTTLRSSTVTPYERGQILAPSPL